MRCFPIAFRSFDLWQLGSSAFISNFSLQGQKGALDLCALIFSQKIVLALGEGDHLYRLS